MKFGVHEMTDIDFIDVPYLEDVLSHLPIEATDKKDVTTYLKNIIDSVLLNYGGEQYQFAYFGMHLLYMTYVYFSVKKISEIIPSRYRDAVIFAKPYHGRKLDFHDLDSVFDYSLVAEKELPLILKTIGLGDEQIGKISALVDNRNDMAHANGRFEILDEQSFEISARKIYESIKNIHKCMDKQIRVWFRDILLQYCDNEFDEYDDISDIIVEQMVQGFNLSAQELLVCNEMSVTPIVVEKVELKDNLNEFKKILKQFCLRQGYVS